MLRTAASAATLRVPAHFITSDADANDGYCRTLELYRNSENSLCWSTYNQHCLETNKVQYCVLPLLLLYTEDY